MRGAVLAKGDRLSLPPHWATPDQAHRIAKAQERYIAYGMQRLFTRTNDDDVPRFYDLQFSDAALVKCATMDALDQLKRWNVADRKQREREDEYRKALAAEKGDTTGYGWQNETLEYLPPEHRPGGRGIGPHVTRGTAPQQGATSSTGNTRPQRARRVGCDACQGRG